jgi:hypothetical protein
LRCNAAKRGWHMTLFSRTTLAVQMHCLSYHLRNLRTKGAGARTSGGVANDLDKLCESGSLGGRRELARRGVNAASADRRARRRNAYDVMSAGLMGSVAGGGLAAGRVLWGCDEESGIGEVV